MAKTPARIKAKEITAVLHKPYIENLPEKLRLVSDLEPYLPAHQAGTDRNPTLPRHFAQTLDYCGQADKLCSSLLLMPLQS